MQITLNPDDFTKVYEARALLAERDECGDRIMKRSIHYRRIEAEEALAAIPDERAEYWTDHISEHFIFTIIG